MAHNILVVDDEPDVEQLIAQRFRREIRKEEFVFRFARNGLQALEELKKHPEISFILSDINMPEMDGLTLLQKVEEMSTPPHFTVIVSAYGDMENIRMAMNRGAFDFVTKPIDFTDLEITIKKTLAHIERQRNQQIEHDQLVAITQDLTVANAIQQSILPKNFPPFPDRNEFDIYASMNAARDVGGDFYDFFLIDESHLGLVMADVSGKGIPAAIFMAVSRTLLKATALTAGEPSACLTKVNDLLSEESVDSMFVTVFYGVLDLRNGEMSFANGGHNPPYVLHPDGSVTSIDDRSGPALGVFPGVPYKAFSATVKAGETLYLYTDGVTEAMNTEDKQYTPERLIGTLQGCVGHKVNEIEQKVLYDVKLFAAGTHQSDDITMLVLKYNGGA